MFYTLCGLCLNYINEQENFKKLSNGLYTDHYATMLNGSETKLLEEPLIQSDYRIFMETSENYRFLIQNNGDWTPPLLSGGFFSGNAKVKEAIVGQQMTSNIITSSNDNYIVVNDEKYKVIGVMGESFASNIDYLVFLFDPDLKSYALKEAKLSIDSTSQKNVDKVTKKLESEYSLKVIQSNQKGLSRTADLPIMYKLLILEFIFLIIVGHVSFLRYIYERETSLRSVLNIFGISRFRIYISFYINFLRNVFLASMCTIINFHLIFEKNHQFLSSLCIIIFFFVLVSTILFNLFFRKDFKMTSERR